LTRIKNAQKNKDKGIYDLYNIEKQITNGFLKSADQTKKNPLLENIVRNTMSLMKVYEREEAEKNKNAVNGERIEI